MPSVNHCYVHIGRGRKALSKIGREWQETARYIAKTEAKKQKWVYCEGKKIVLELMAFWPDYRTRDMSNMHKLLPDVLQDILYDNDKWVLVRDINFEVDKNNPRVEVKIYPLEAVR